MSDPLRPLRVNAVELLRQPGAKRRVTASIDATDLDVHHATLAGDISVDVELAVVDDGITVTGGVSAPWTGECRLCLRPIEGDAVAEVAELYQVDVTDEDAEPIEGGRIDLSPVVRQLILIELTAERQCRPDCAGLCPSCGIDRNSETCDCDPHVRDERWAVLDGLVLDDRSGPIT